MIQTISTPSEVVAITPAGRQFPHKHICDLILPTEMDVLPSLIGNELHGRLLLGLSEMPNAPIYQAGTYNNGDIVRYYGVLYENTIDGNTNNPDGDGWVCWQKFEDECLNTLWHCYLRYIVAYRVYAKAVIFATTQSGSNGLTRIGSTDLGVVGANDKEQDRYVRNLLDVAEMYQRGLSQHLKDTDATCKWNLSKCLCDGTTAPTILQQQQKGNRRWSFLE